MLLTITVLYLYSALPSAQSTATLCPSPQALAVIPQGNRDCASGQSGLEGFSTPAGRTPGVPSGPPVPARKKSSSGKGPKLGHPVQIRKSPWSWPHQQRSGIA